MLFYGGMKVAVMQPYFFPYRGYHRLIEESDLFIIFDCVQFPRRGWVHRNKPRSEGSWLTIPIEKCELGTKICDVRLSHNYDSEMRNRIRKFPEISKHAFEDGKLMEALFDTEDERALPLIVNSLKYSCEILGIDFNYIFSSDLEIDEGVYGENRILSILENVGAEGYVNSPSGRDLYSEDKFRERGVELSFLPPWDGSFDSVLTMILLGNHY